MKITTDYPYDEYVGYLCINPENRRNVCLVHKITKKRTTVSYARYLMAVSEKRILNKNEQVDHMDEDKTNDILSNLQILTQIANTRKSVIDRNRTQKMVELKCPSCDSIFIKPFNYTQKGYHYNVCSKECLYEMGRRNLTIKQLIKIGKKQRLRYFRK